MSRWYLSGVHILKAAINNFSVTPKHTIKSLDSSKIENLRESTKIKDNFLKFFFFVPKKNTFLVVVELSYFNKVHETKEMSRNISVFQQC